MIVTAGSALSLAVLYLIVGLLVANLTAGRDPMDSHGLGVVVAWPVVVIVAAAGITIMAVAQTDD